MFYTHTHTHPLCLAIYGFIQNTRPHVLLQRTEWLQPAENLHGNKSYNLSPVCTLDWLKAITLTKKASPPSSSSFSLPYVKLILWTFWKISVFSFLAWEWRHSPSSSPFFWFADMAPGIEDFFLTETAVKNSPRLQRAFSLFVLPDPSLISQLD